MPESLFRFKPYHRLLSCQDCLLNRQYAIWDRDSREAVFTRNLCRRENANCENTCQEFMETRPENVVANILLCLISQTTFLLRKQIAAQEKQFLQYGGIREQMTKARLEARRK